MTQPIQAHRPASARTSSSRDARSTGPTSRWVVLALAATWSVTYLGLGIAWLAGAGGNPADPAVDDSPGLSLLTVWGPQVGASVLTALAGLGILLAAMTWMWVLRTPPRAPVALRRLSTVLAAGLGLMLAVVLPDYRLLASIALHPDPAGVDADRCGSRAGHAVDLAGSQHGGAERRRPGLDHHRRHRSPPLG